MKVFKSEEINVLNPIVREVKVVQICERFEMSVNPPYIVVGDVKIVQIRPLSEVGERGEIVLRDDKAVDRLVLLETRNHSQVHL